MEATKTILRLQRDIEREVAGFDGEADFNDWAQDSLLPLLEGFGAALGELAEQTAAGFAETAEVLSEVLEDDDDDDAEEEYLIPVEITSGVTELLNLASGIIRAMIDGTAPEALGAQIAAFDVGGREMVEKMKELTEDEEDDDDDDEVEDEVPEPDDAGGDADEE